MLLNLTSIYTPCSYKTHDEVDFNVSYGSVVFGMPLSFASISEQGMIVYTDTAQDLDCFAF